jgi:carbon monoxide dehydrogenase subunit G
MEYEGMKVSGDAMLNGPVDRVYAMLNDPTVLVRTIPGCERLEQIGPDAYRMVVTAGVAAIKGTYSGEVRLSEQDAPHAFVLKASGSGAPGTVEATARVKLAAGTDGTTVVSYDADAVVGGMIGGVGQRMLSTVAKRTAGEFFSAVDGVLTGAVVSTVEGEPAVFTRPTAPTAHTPDFARGVLFGAAAALIGAVVGAMVSRRRRSD